MIDLNLFISIEFSPKVIINSPNWAPIPLHRVEAGMTEVLEPDAEEE